MKTKNPDAAQRTRKLFSRKPQTAISLEEKKEKKKKKIAQALK